MFEMLRADEDWGLVREEAVVTGSKDADSHQESLSGGPAATVSHHSPALEGL